jgi:hypothetical protein
MVKILQISQLLQEKDVKVKNPIIVANSIQVGNTVLNEFKIKSMYTRLDTIEKQLEDFSAFRALILAGITK